MREASEALRIGGRAGFDPASYRDRAGRVFRQDGRLLRAVYEHGLADYERLIASGLYAELVKDGRIVPHRETAPHASHGPARKVLEPETVPVISYPYEWCFDQLKDAALVTLAIQRASIARGMSLKDASAFNIQFVGSRPVLIDTLSVARACEGAPWPAYRQFCRHFLAPLALMARVEPTANRYFRADLEGMPLGLASAALPWTTRLNPHLLIHLHAHAAMERRARRFGPSGVPTRRFRPSEALGLVDSLESAVRSLKGPRADRRWAEYYTDGHNYSDEGLAEKERHVAEWLGKIEFRAAWDIGGNTGRFSRLCSARGASTLMLDNDPLCVNRLYLELREKDDPRLTPLQYDIADPTPGLGWAGEERAPLEGRHRPDLILALAVVHHLVIGRNLTFDLIAERFSRLAPHLIIEFVPKDDSQTRRLLAGREDVFHDYGQEAFLAAFGRRYEIAEERVIRKNRRTLYRMTARSSA